MYCWPPVCLLWIAPQTLAAYLLVWVHPIQPNRRSAIQWYIPLQSIWVIFWLNYLAKCLVTDISILGTLWFSVVPSVTRLLYYFSIFGLLEQWQFAQNYQVFAKVGSQFCQILNNYSRNGQKLINFFISGKISTNLVTLYSYILSKTDLIVFYVNR